ncbi:DUF6153 family protein [Streptomyces sp. 8L]|uniref:DUF6153 family protein n=1 Tax=Streptomyces sp. 8L TaxID=2877242 RepID=UPI001CD55A54|nr:DUF6153 family protein [Streptomyces sp. 8L]MCA1219069.1 DUF6153 family protein [Streptomyces sp. 8L]
MATISPSPAPPSAVRTALILALLAGVLAMHGLAQHGAPGPGYTASGSTGHTAPAARGTAAPHGGPSGAAGRAHGTDPAPCGGGAEGSGGHAATMCLADSTATGYTAPVLTEAGTALPAPGTPATAAGAPRAVPGRAPPDLSELQLLRI